MVITHWSKTDKTAVLSQLERMLQCEMFSHGERQSRFLRHIVEATLDGNAEQLNQFTVGVDVFDRDETFDPTIDSIVRVEAGRLRAKLTQYYAEVGKDDPVRIDLPKGGYAVAIRITPKSPSKKSATQLRPSRLAVYAIAAGMVATIAAVFILLPFLGLPAPRAPEAVEELGTRKTTDGTLAIAVLPFDNMSSEPEQGYFSDGITEDIITDLSIISGLRVIARNSTFVYKNKATKIEQIGHDLNVSHVLEGSVRKVDDRVRITAQLIDVSTQSHIWAHRYDRPVNDIFAIQEEVSQKIVTALEVALTDIEKKRLTHKRTTNIDAHDALLRGKEQFYQFKPDGVALSVALFSTAIERDAGYAEAYAWKSRALVFQFIAGFASSKQETVGQGLVLANHAVKLDGMLPMAHANLAWALRWNSQLDEASVSVARAVELDPNFAEAYIWQSLIHSSNGEGKKALETIVRSLRLNPNYGVTSIFAIGRARFELGELSSAIEQFNRGIDRNPNFLPNHVYKVFALEKSGKPDAAKMARQAMADINPKYEQSASYRYYFNERR